MKSSTHNLGLQHLTCQLQSLFPAFSLSGVSLTCFDAHLVTDKEPIARLWTKQKRFARIRTAPQHMVEHTTFLDMRASYPLSCFRLHIRATSCSWTQLRLQERNALPRLSLARVPRPPPLSNFQHPKITTETWTNISGLISLYSDHCGIVLNPVVKSYVNLHGLFATFLRLEIGVDWTLHLTKDTHVTKVSLN